MGNEFLKEVWQRSVKLAKAAEEASCQLTELLGWNQVQVLKDSFLQSQPGEVGKKRDDATGCAYGKGRQARVLGY